MHIGPFFNTNLPLLTVIVFLQSPLRGGHELHTLSENEEDEMAIELGETTMMEGERRGGREMDIETAMTERGREMLGEPVFEETMLSSQLSSDEPFISSTLISSDHTHSLTGMPRHHITSPPTENYDFNSPPTLSDVRSPPTLSDEFSLPSTETHEIHHTTGPLYSLGNISSGPSPPEDLTGPTTLRSSAPQPPAKLTASPQRPLAPQPSAKLTGPPQRSLPPTNLTGPPPHRPLAPQPSAKLTGLPQRSLPPTDLTGPPPQRPLGPQPSAKLTGPPQRSLPPMELTGPPQRPLAPQPSAKLTGPPQRLLNDQRDPPIVSNERSEDVEFLDVS